MEEKDRQVLSDLISKTGGQMKYFSLAMILAFFQRQQLERFSQEAFKRRNNVESSIFQLSYYTRKNKTRYREMIKHKWWAYNRCLWVNLVRIKNWTGEVCPDGTKFKIGFLEETQ